MIPTDASPQSGPLDEATLSRYLCSPLRFFNEGFRCECFASSTIVLKLFHSPESLRRAFARAGIELGQVAWSPVPGDSEASAAALVERAISSAATALSRIPELTGLIAGRLHGEPCALRAQCWTRQGVQAVPLGERFWVLQHRAEPLAPHLFSADIAKGKRAAQLMIEALDRLWQAGATPETEFFLDSFGLFGGKAILLDVNELRFGRAAVAEERSGKSLLSGDAFKKLAHLNPTVAAYLENAYLERLESAGDLT